MSEGKKDYSTIVSELNDYSPEDVEYLKYSNKGKSIDENIFGIMLDNKFSNLCKIAKMDAWHDHHTIDQLDSNTIDEFVVRHLPTGFNCYKQSSSSSSGTSGNTPGSVKGDGRPSDEDVFIYRMFLDLDKIDEGEKMEQAKKLCKPSCSMDYKTANHGDSVFNETITSRYNVGHIPFISDKSDEGESSSIMETQESESNNCKYDENQSQIEKFFKEIGITEDIHIIRDVAYGNWADDIAKWGKGTELTGGSIITVQTASGIFDPGPSTHCFTSAGKRQGFTDINCKSRYALFESYNKEDFLDEETVVFYPRVVDDEDEDESPLFRNQLLYTRFNCTLYGKTSKLPENIGNLYDKKDVLNFIESANVNFVVSVPDESDPNKESIYISTKKTSNKAQSIAELPDNDSFIKMSAVSKTEGPGTYDKRVIENYGRDFVINKSGKLRIMTKKFGDHGQAVTACKPKLTYKLIEPADNNANNFIISTKTSTGVHAFLSYDRVAVASAVYYGVPIVIFVNQQGAIIFYSKKFDSFKTPAVRYASSVELCNKKINEYKLSKSKWQEIGKGNDWYTGEIEKIVTNLNTIFTTIQDIYDYLINDENINKAKAGKCDLIYQTLFMILLSISSSINIFSSHIKISTIKDIVDPDLNVETINDTLDEAQINENIQRIDERLKVLNNAMGIISGNISLYHITNNISKNILNITTLCINANSVSGGDADPYKKFISLKNNLKINSVTRRLIDSFNPYSGTQNPSTWRSSTNKLNGQVGCELGLVLLEDIYENLQNYRFIFSSVVDSKNTDLMSVFSRIFKKIFNKAKPEIIAFFLTPMGRKLNANSTEQLNVISPEERASLEGEIAKLNKDINDILKTINVQSKIIRKKGSKQEQIKEAKKNLKTFNKNLQEKEKEKHEKQYLLSLQENTNSNYERSERLFLPNVFKNKEEDEESVTPNTYTETTPTKTQDLELIVNTVTEPTDEEETGSDNIESEEGSEDLNTDLNITTNPVAETNFTKSSNQEVSEEKAKKKPIKTKSKKLIYEAVAQRTRSKNKELSNNAISIAEGIIARRKGRSGGQKKRKRITKNKKRKQKRKTRRRRTHRKRGGRDDRLTRDNTVFSPQFSNEDAFNKPPFQDPIQSKIYEKPALKPIDVTVDPDYTKETSFDYLYSSISTMVESIGTVTNDNELNILFNNSKKLHELQYVNTIVLSMMESMNSDSDKMTGGGTHDVITTTELYKLRDIRSIRNGFKEKLITNIKPQPSFSDLMEGMEKIYDFFNIGDKEKYNVDSFKSITGKDGIKNNIIFPEMIQNDSTKEYEIHFTIYTVTDEGGKFTLNTHLMTLNGFAYLKHMLNDNATPPNEEQLLKYKREILKKYTDFFLENKRMGIKIPDEENESHVMKKQLDTINEYEAMLNTDDDAYDLNPNVILQTLITNLDVYVSFMDFLTQKYDDLREFELFDYEKRKEELKKYHDVNTKNKFITLHESIGISINSYDAKIDKKLKEIEEKEDPLSPITIEEAEQANTLDEINELIH